MKCVTVPTHTNLCGHDHKQAAHDLIKMDQLGEPLLYKSFGARRLIIALQVTIGDVTQTEEARAASEASPSDN